MDKQQIKLHEIPAIKWWFVGSLFISDKWHLLEAARERVNHATSKKQNSRASNFLLQIVDRIYPIYVRMWFQYRQKLLKQVDKLGELHWNYIINKKLLSEQLTKMWIWDICIKYFSHTFHFALLVTQSINLGRKQILCFGLQIQSKCQLTLSLKSDGEPDISKWLLANRLEARQDQNQIKSHSHKSSQITVSWTDAITKSRRT